MWTLSLLHISTICISDYSNAFGRASSAIKGRPYTCLLPLWRGPERNNSFLSGLPEMTELQRTYIYISLVKGYMVSVPARLFSHRYSWFSPLSSYLSPSYHPPKTCDNMTRYAAKTLPTFEFRYEKLGSSASLMRFGCSLHEKLGWEIDVRSLKLRWQQERCILRMRPTVRSIV